MRRDPTPALVPRGDTAPTPQLERWQWRLRGAVQGVGFRPWCAHEADARGLGGWVRNDAQGLHLELQGPAPALAAFAQRLHDAPPPLARIDRLEHRPLPLEPDERGFTIVASATGGPTGTGLPADAAPCEACLRELFDPQDRRYRHAFITCTHCGPRFTITARLPYDRPQTSLAGFPMCAACAAEYHDPRDRRHHAQPIACPRCGPRLALWAADGTPLDVSDPVAEAARRLAAGQVLAVKGVGGYHLVADARQAAPLARLRAAKQRAGKPFALLAPNVASVQQWVTADDHDAALLRSPARPILLLPCRPGVSEAHPMVAPGLGDWGLMLPSAPLHWLLLHELLGRPAGDAWRAAPQPVLLVMTSANPGGEPLVTDEDEAVQRLSIGLADALLVHDRPILGRTDDSVRRPLGIMADGRPSAPFVRRARGHVPDPIPLPGVPDDAPPVLAAGAWMKATVCVTRGAEAFLSPHLGDMGNAASRQGLVDAVGRLCGFLGVTPQAIAHDLDADAFGSRHAAVLAARWGVPLVGVQHHQAHAAAVLAEHGALHEPALALVLDGVGRGDDGRPWGGELLTVHGARMTRLGHLPTLVMAGGDRAAAEPWRMGAAVLHALGRGAEIAARFAGEPAAARLQALLDAGPRHGPPTSSAGRLFDAAASLLGVAQRHRHEADAAMRLEAVAQRAAGAPAWPDAFAIDADGGLDLHGLWRQLADAGPFDTGHAEATGGRPASAAPAAQADAAARFHASLAAALVAWVAHHARVTGLAAVALGGGCFINRLLREAVVTGLAGHGLRVLEAEQAPPGDGGLSLGQAAVALAQILSTPNPSEA